MEKCQIAVPVATVWTAPDAVRLCDKKAVSNPVDMEGWLAEMTREENIALCRESRLQSQVLFGDDVWVERSEGDWARVLIPSQASSKDRRGYPGWMPRRQLAEPIAASPEDERVMVQSKKAGFYNEKKEWQFDLSFGTFLTWIDCGKNEVKVRSPIGDGYLFFKDVSFPGQAPRADGAAIIRQAECFLHLPYLWAGLSAYGYDCSGFSYSMMRAGGYLIPRDADDQARGGREIGHSLLKPGDLLYFAYDEGKGAVHHVGIYYGGGKMIHSPTPGKRIDITALEGTIYEREFCTARRYWKGENEDGQDSASAS